MELTAELVNSAQQERDDPWRVGNQALYELCRTHPRHVDAAEIIAKVWLVGRAYSASIERRPKPDPAMSNDRFYTEAVPNALSDRKYRLDDRLKALEHFSELGEANVGPVLVAHECLVKCFRDLTGLGKRSLASKYLHFHLPNLFFIYDSRAASSIRSLPGGRRAIKAPRGVDGEYAKFVGAALGVREHVLSEFGESLSPRQLDRLLLRAFASGV